MNWIYSVLMFVSLMAGGPPMIIAESTTCMFISLDPNATKPLSDPSTDPKWPGLLPPPESLYEVVVNIHYDDYATETSWVLEQYVSSSLATIARSDSAIEIRTTATDPLLSNGEWMEVDSYQGTFADGATLASYRHFSSPNSLYRFVLKDEFHDGICCDFGGGWVTLTNRTEVVWGLPGDAFEEESRAYFSIDMDGNTELLSAVEMENVFDQSALANMTFLPNYSLPALTQDSPQKNALVWLVQHPEYPTMAGWRKEQLFGLSTFLHSTGASKWLNASLPECDWIFQDEEPKKLECDNEGRIQKLSWVFESYTLQGPIPPEISLLSALTEFDVTNQYLESQLPTHLFSLTNLTTIWLGHNELTGSLPSEVGLLTNVRTLSLGPNAFTGTIPDEISKLTDMSWLHLGGMESEDKVAIELCHLDRLTTLIVDCDTISCPCDACRCD